MESRAKPSFNGVSGASDSRRGYMGATAGGGRPPVDGCSVALRVFILAATLVAAVVMGVDRQTKTILVTVADTLPPLQVPVTAKWSYSTAFLTCTQVLRGGERDGVRLLGGGAGGVPQPQRGGAGDDRRPGGDGAAVLGGGRGGGVRHPGGARQLPRALGQGVQRLWALLRARHVRRHRLAARRLRQPRPPHAQHPHHPQELLVLLASTSW